VQCWCRRPVNSTAASSARARRADSSGVASARILVAGSAHWRARTTRPVSGVAAARRRPVDQQARARRTGGPGERVAGRAPSGPVAQQGVLAAKSLRRARRDGDRLAAHDQLAGAELLAGQVELRAVG